MGLTGSVRRVHTPLRDLSSYQGPEQRRAPALLLYPPECVEEAFSEVRARYLRVASCRPQGVRSSTGKVNKPSMVGTDQATEGP